MPSMGLVYMVCLGFLYLVGFQLIACMPTPKSFGPNINNVDGCRKYIIYNPHIQTLIMDMLCCVSGNS